MFDIFCQGISFNSRNFDFVKSSGILLSCYEFEFRIFKFPDSSSSWTAHKVELTLWTHYMANKLDISVQAEAGSAAKKRKSVENGSDGDAKKTKAK